MITDMETICLQNLSKTFPNGKKAVKNISLSLNEGEVFGFLGPNGAGKTTTVKMLTGILLPSEGSCSVMEVDPAQEPAKAHAFSGIVTEHAQMYDQMTGFQNLMFYAAVFGISAKEGKQRSDALLNQLGLSEAADQPLSSYSTGMRQRLSLARALIHSPRVLFLDEPTSGLDPESAQQVNHLIRTLASEEKITIFLCTHQLRYAQEICSRYGLINSGCLLASGTLEELRARISRTAVLRIRSDQCAPCLSFRRSGQGWYETEIRSEDEIPGIVRSIVEAGGNIYAVETKYPDLEEIYFTLTSGNKEETE